MFYSQINPVLAGLWGLEIRFYGLIYAISFLLMYFFLNYLVEQRKIRLDKTQVSNLVIWLILGVVVGARIFYVLLYNFRYYANKPLEILMPWHGGMSFHGGLVGVIIAGLLFSRKYKINFYKIADAIAIPTAVFLMLGRIANFTNSELYGRVTGLPWAVKFQGVEGFRHPSQIYQSFSNLVIFSVLWFIKDKKKLPDGYLFWLLISIFGLFRFITEFF